MQRIPNQTGQQSNWINETGNLNSRAEFSLNHLCKLVSDMPQCEAHRHSKPRDKEKKAQNSFIEKLSEKLSKDKVSTSVGKTVGSITMNAIN